jgi:hypothetical protein
MSAATLRHLSVDWRCPAPAAATPRHLSVDWRCPAPAASPRGTLRLLIRPGGGRARAPKDCPGGRSRGCRRGRGSGGQGWRPEGRTNLNRGIFLSTPPERRHLTTMRRATPWDRHRWHPRSRPGGPRPNGPSRWPPTPSSRRGRQRRPASPSTCRPRPSGSCGS